MFLISKCREDVVRGQREWLGLEVGSNLSGIASRCMYVRLVMFNLSLCVVCGEWSGRVRAVFIILMYESR